MLRARLGGAPVFVKSVDGQCEVLESPAWASPRSCDVDHVVDDGGVLNGIAIGFTSFGTSTE